MRTNSGDNPYGATPYEAGNNYKAWAAYERGAVREKDLTDFLACLWRLADEKKKATGNSGNLPSSIFSEQVRQIARKRGWAECRIGSGWLLTEAGRKVIAP